MKNKEKQAGKQTNGAAGTDAWNGQTGRASRVTSPMKVKLMMVREGRMEKVAIQGPQDVFNFMRKEASYLDREYFWRIDLDTRNYVLSMETCSIGTLSASLVHPREYFKGAILSNAAATICCHNHPSQDTNPSPEDREATRRIKKAGELLGIPLHDHIILADEGFFSFREKGLL